MRFFSPILIGLILMIFSSCRKASLVKNENSPPNVVFLFADDQRYQTIHRMGNAEISTPNLDKLSSRGVTFTNAYIMGGTSGAVCAPSRAMFWTGKTLFHLDHEGEWNFPILKRDTTFLELLRHQGYVTHGIGKQHNGKAVVARAFSSGGHFMFGGMSDHYDIPVFDFNSDSNYQDEKKYRVLDKHSTDLYADDAVNFIQSYQEDSPFFLYVAFQAPHDPREMPENFLHLYDEREIDLPPNFLPRHPFDNGELEIRDELLASFPRTKEEILTHIRAYYAMISHLDAAIGRILAAIEKKGIRDQTLIIFSADNGLAVGQHGLMGKQNVYEHSIKIPMILSGPGIPEDETREAFCYLNDIYPTLCDYLGTKPPATVETRSFLDCIQDREASHRPYLVFAYKNFQRAIRKGPWKYIEYSVNNQRHVQLFNLEEDPYETHNLAEERSGRSVAEGLRLELKNEWIKLGDTSDFWHDNY